MLAMTDFSDPRIPRRLNFGFIAASDNHSAKPGTGYKEVSLKTNTDARYYIRPQQFENEAIDPLIEDAWRVHHCPETGEGCEYDENGVCVTMRDCGSDPRAPGDCLAPAQHRAWSSPIFVNFDKQDL